ncbi:chromosome partitioning protein [Brachybacterium avium]|uniref:Chromosome partitioning protein n=2 Tax=Brachybacterium avium TaxID=2017485 RepID=A0A220UG50_9MICO|nr:chromosome partitioning protein [Brachybacterium avium]
MIAQARITSDTTATVHLAEETVEVSGADLPEIRDRVKQAFIAAAKAADQDLDVVIVEPDVRHHLRVEPSGRIAGREADQRPVHGPQIDDPLIAPPTDDTADLSGIDRTSLRPRTGEHAAITSGEHVAIGSPATGEHPVIGSPATGQLPTVRPHGGRRRRAAAMPPSTGPASAESPAGSLSSTPSTHSAQSAQSAASAHSAQSAASAASAGSPAIASSAPSAPSASPAPFAPVAPAAPAEQPATSKRPLPARTAPETDSSRPTLKDLQSSTAKPARVKATRGVPGFITRLTRGAISPRPTRRERNETERLERIRRPLDGPRNIAVVNLKGGAHKTTASLMIAATLGVTRGGNVLAWDNNETRGTLGWRGIPTDHPRTAVDLLHDIDRLRSPEASNADLDPYVRPQGGMRFDILASDEDPGSAASIDAAAFGELNDALSRFYRIKVIDTGNNVRASNWLAAVKSADQLIIVSTVREDTFNAAAWMIDELRATGLAEQVDHAVTILSHSSKGKLDSTLRDRLRAHFGAHTRAVTEVPYEHQFVDGSHLEWERVSQKTKEAWLDATALIIDGL